MPFTPFHFGPSFLIGILFVGNVNMASILLASVAMDIEPIYCISSSSCPLHGFLHTYVGATVLSLAGVSAAIYFARKQLTGVSDALGVRQDYSLKSIIIGALIGGWSHVFLDSFLYPDLLPLWPVLPTNPFVGILDSQATYLITIIGFIAGAAAYFWRLNSILRAEKADSRGR